MKPVLICGGVGKKMWPFSRQRTPKHFLPLFSGKSLYQVNYELLREKFKPGEIYIQTTAGCAKTALEQAPGVPRENCFIEPELRDHGPAMGLMAAKLFTIDPDEPFTLVQVDVLREPGNAYLETIAQCEVLVKKEKKLVTGGIRPSYPVMGVDYLRTEEKGKKKNGVKFFKIVEYLDRDIGRKAIEKLLKQKLILVHANHYSWTPRLFLEAYQKLATDWYQPLKKMMASFGSQGEETVVKQEYAKMKKARVERVTQLIFSEGYVFEAPFKWFDFGTWESLSKYETEVGTYDPGENFLNIDSENCYVKKDEEKFVGLIGVNDLLVVDTEDALLICKRDQSVRVQEIVAKLGKTNGKDHYL